MRRKIKRVGIKRKKERKILINEGIEENIKGRQEGMKEKLRMKGLKKEGRKEEKK